MKKSRDIEKLNNNSGGGDGCGDDDSDSEKREGIGEFKISNSIVKSVNNLPHGGICYQIMEFSSCILLCVDHIQI